LQVGFTFDRADGRASAEVKLGHTRCVPSSKLTLSIHGPRPHISLLPPLSSPPPHSVHAEATAAVASPSPDRPLEGTIAFNVEITPFAEGGPSSVLAGGGGAAAAGGGGGGGAGGGGSSRSSPAAVAIARILERQVRDARAVDTEALCILPGKKVWALRVDVRVLDDGGNVTDAAALAAMGALLHLRRADVTVRGDEAVVHSYAERAPVPLAIHHIPVCVSFALFSPACFAALASAIAGGMVPGAPSLPPSPVEDEVTVLDPGAKEALVADGALTLVMNAHKELCGVHKVGGCPVPPSSLVTAARMGAEVAARLVAALQGALGKAEEAEAARARARHAASAGYLPPGIVDVGAAVTAGAREGASAGVGSAGAAAASKGGVRVVMEDEEEEAETGGAGGKLSRKGVVREGYANVEGAGKEEGEEEDEDDEEDDEEAGDGAAEPERRALAGMASLSATLDGAVAAAKGKGKR
jgi:exosome complex component RRP45